MPAPPTEMPAAVQVVSAGWTGDGQGGCTGSSSVDTPQEYAVPKAGQVIYAEFAVAGIEDGTPVNFDFYALDGETLLSSGEQVWDFGSEEICIFVPVRGAQGRERRKRGVPGRGPGARPEPGGVRRAVGRGSRDASISGARAPAANLTCLCDLRMVATTHSPPAAERPRPPSPEEVETALRAYEVMVILDPSLEERTVEPSLDKYLNVIRKDGGSVDSLEVWGRRRLAYEIDKNAEGIYAVITLQAEPDTVKEFDRQLGLNEAILRTKVLRPTV